MVGYAYSCSSQKPAWLEALHTEKFFVSCLAHENAKKNEKNIFCLDCCKSICPHCLPSHRSHRLLQVRRYVYHDVVRLEDLEKLIDCSNVQAYTINSAKVVFLNQRPQSRPFKGSGNTCTTCDRSLQEPYFHCSIGCKVDYIIKQRKDLSQFLYDCKTLPLSDFVFTHCMDKPAADDSRSGATDEGQMTPNSVLDSGDSFSANKKIFENSRSAHFDLANPCASQSISRRKGTPHRSPLF